MGYTKYRAVNEDSSALWQKCIRDADGTKLYFINIHEYPPYLYQNQCSYQPEARFYLNHSDKAGFDVLYHENVGDITVIEDFFDTVYRGLNCVPDVNNN